MRQRAPRSTLFPYTTLFRSAEHVADVDERVAVFDVDVPRVPALRVVVVQLQHVARSAEDLAVRLLVPDRGDAAVVADVDAKELDRKSTRLNSSHANISYAVF